MPAEPMPRVQAEIRAQMAVTSASKFKAKPEATIEADVPRWRGWCGLRPHQLHAGKGVCGVHSPGKCLRSSICSEMLDRATPASSQHSREGTPDSEYEPLGAGGGLVSQMEKLRHSQLAAGRVRSEPGLLPPRAGLKLFPTSHVVLSVKSHNVFQSQVPLLPSCLGTYSCPTLRQTFPFLRGEREKKLLY